MVSKTKNLGGLAGAGAGMASEARMRYFLNLAQVEEFG